MTTLRALSIEQLAELAPGDALRRRIDERNSASLGRVALFLGGANAIVATRPLIFFLAGEPPSAALRPAAIGIVLALFTVWINSAVARDDRGFRWIRQRLRALIGSFLASEFALILLALGIPATFFQFNAYLGFVALYPFLAILWFRFELPELLLLHGFLFAAATAQTLQIPRSLDGPPVGMVITMAFFWNAAALAVGVRLTTGLRKLVGEEHHSARDAGRMRDELRMARDLQLSMLPDAPPAIDGLDIAGVSIPATEVGGDYYDYIVLEEGVAVVCADVAGHGLASGITLATLRGALMLVGDSLRQPATLMQRLSGVVAQSSRRRMLVTMSLVLFDRTAKKATIGSAGHPPLILRRASGEVEAVEIFAPPLGSRLAGSVPQKEIGFAAGDVFVLHSDGLYETVDRAGEPYGMERLGRLVASLDGSAAEIRDGILREIARYRGDRPQEDDMTLVVVKIGG